VLHVIWLSKPLYLSEFMGLSASIIKLPEIAVTQRSTKKTQSSSKSDVGKVEIENSIRFICFTLSAYEASL
jgi:hypothetical protein